MFSDGPNGLEKVVAFGNFWHGRLTTAGNFVSALGVEVPAESVERFAYYHAAESLAEYTTKLCVNHLVDFDMPELDTPAADAEKGLVYYNKALLFGQHKYYSISSDRCFGSSGWPYKAPDGSVWHLTAYLDETDSAVKILASPLGGTGQSTLASISLSGLDLYTKVCVTSVNFSPKDGANAAAHVYYTTNADAYPFSDLQYVVEIAVSGGSVNDYCTQDVTYPEAVCEITYTPDDVVVYFKNGEEPATEYFGETGVSVAQEYPIGETFPGGYPIYFRLQKVSYRGRYAKQWDTDSHYDTLGGVVYTKDGNRAVLSGRNGTATHCAYTEMQPTYRYRWYAAYYGDDGAWHSCSHSAPLPSPSDWWEYGEGWEFTSEGSSYAMLLRDGVALVTNSVTAQQVEDDAPGQFSRFARSASNVFVMGGRGVHSGPSPEWPYASQVVLGIVTADVHYGWPNSVEVLPSPLFIDNISVNADTGEFDPNTVFYY